ncbi:NADAR family protein [Oceanirhabdus sp. W0125-5]|uniref:NADAR family protein n=1 Tax=Oceanirhabdus sp. W0125-5 TaxID=2999116 RepID=UPI0022F334CD|nr:NADAR family protein [Oceanirhabdus sp. W0125-5]WBW99707.1 NADAR family protein [Oceanirhabdus sp. W0125-5]
MWKTSEHYFQAMKFEGTEHYDLINQAKTPMIAAKMGRDRTRPLRKDWEDVKDDIMYKALKAKFDSDEELRNILLSTGDALLIEHTRNDLYWADGVDGTGKNMLGILLMKLRESYDEYFITVSVEISGLQFWGRLPVEDFFQWEKKFNKLIEDFPFKYQE